MRTLHRTGAGLLALALAGGLAACGDDNTKDSTPEATEESTTTEAPGEAGTVEVTAVDYAFEGLPDSVAAGTKLTLTNSSTAEIHELRAFLLPDGEERSADELIVLPDSELEQLIPQGPPTAELLAPPNGGEMILEVGDGTLADPGRYLMVCTVPTGADPDAVLNAAAREVVPGGPLHFTKGMYAELTVE